MKRSKQQVSVLEVVRNAPFGVTCEEVENITGLKHQSASARLRELSQDSEELGPSPVWRITEKRKNESGRKAFLYLDRSYVELRGAKRHPNDVPKQRTDTGGYFDEEGKWHAD